MNRSILFVLLFVGGLCLLAPITASAAIYKYIDKDGLVTFANDLQAVPLEHRAKAVIVSGEQKEEEDLKPAAGTVSPQEQPTPKAVEQAPVHSQPIENAEPGGKRSFGSRALTSAIVVVSAMFAFVILGIIDADHKKAIMITRVVIIWLMSVFLLYSHAADVFHLFRSFGNDVEEARQKSGEKGKKAAEAMKALNAVVEQTEQSSTEAPAARPEKKE